MGSGDVPPLRSLPRVFVPGASAEGEIELPKEEVDKFRRVLRLSAGATIAVLPDDGTLIVCKFTGRVAIPEEVHRPDVEPVLQLTLAQAFPKGDKLDEIIRAGTSLGVSRFLLFPSERSVVRWDSEKVAHKLNRLQTIAREACEVSFRTRLPRFELASSLAEVLSKEPQSLVMAETEGLQRHLPNDPPNPATVVIGPEGGWSPHELQQVGDRGFTMGPRVLRVEHAGAAACALLLLK